MASSAPSLAAEAVMVTSEPMPEDTPTVKGYDFNEGLNLKAVLDTYVNCGYQATHFGRAVEELNKMVNSTRAAPLTDVSTAGMATKR